MGNLFCSICPENQDNSKSSISNLNDFKPKQSDTKSLSHYDNGNLNKSQQNLKPNIKPIDIKNSEQQLDDKHYLVLIGPSGAGKEKLIKQMNLKKIQYYNSRYSLQDQKNLANCQQQNFQEEILDEYVIVATPSFQLDDDINIREIIIKEFQEYFDNRKYISSFGIVVNFERTDLMKKKVLQVLKYLRKFKDIISIIVVDMELSDNVDEDKEHLRNSFKHMGCHRILFISKEMKQKQILEQIQEIQFIKTHIDLTDTIFQSIDIIDEHRIQSEFISQIIQCQIRS
ncbi:unnamed protein product [Paramecium primaurelia]|uniref:Uncharacterized protein n=1 Tax=Paramecium primaurelia TaxID=5886 RepID=A0A8S1N251_PARPR|nr:unnamed protein product [Paramecium primaurelia]